MAKKFRFRIDFRDLFGDWSPSTHSWTRANGELVDSRAYVGERTIGELAHNMVERAIERQLDPWQVFQLTLPSIQLKQGAPCSKMEEQFRDERLKLESATIESVDGHWELLDGNARYIIREISDSTVGVFMRWEDTTLAALVSPALDKPTDMESARLPILQRSGGMTDALPEQESPRLLKYLEFVASSNASISLPIKTISHPFSFSVKSLFCRQQIAIRPPSIRERNSTLVESNPIKLIVEHRRIALLGDWGTGKTTLASYIAYKLARREESTVPVLLNFPRHGKIAWSEVHSLDDLVKNILKLDGFSDVDAIAAEILSAFKSGNAVLLVDGYDDLNIRARQNLVGLVSKWSRHYRDGMFVISGRYTDENLFVDLMRDDFYVCELRPTLVTHREYVQKLHELRILDDTSFEHIQRYLSEHTQATSFRSSMFLMAIMSQYFASHPVEHHDGLFDAIMSDLIGRVPRGSHSINTLTACLTLFAAFLEQQSISAALDANVVQHWIESDHCPTIADPAAGLEALQNIVDSSGILSIRWRDNFLHAGEPSRTVQFAHASFQAYFAAQARTGPSVSLDQSLFDRLLTTIRQAPLTRVRVVFDETRSTVESYYDPAVEEEFLKRFQQLKKDDQTKLLETMVDFEKASARQHANTVLAIKALPTAELGPSQLAFFVRRSLCDMWCQYDTRYLECKTQFDLAISRLSRITSVQELERILIDELQTGNSITTEKACVLLIQIYDNAEMNRCIDDIDSCLATVATANGDLTTRVRAAAGIYRASWSRPGFTLEVAQRVIDIVLSMVGQFRELNWFLLHTAYGLTFYQDLVLSESQLSMIRKILDAGPTVLMGAAASILARQKRPTVYEQRDWTLELAHVADGKKLRRDLPRVRKHSISNSDRARISACLESPLFGPPDRQRVAMAMGRIGLTTRAMINPLVEIVSHGLDRQASHEAAFYLGRICQRFPKTVNRLIPLVTNGDIALDMHLLLIWLDDYETLRRQLDVECHWPGRSLQDAMVALLMSSDPRGKRDVHLAVKSPDPRLALAAQNAIAQTIVSHLNGRESARAWFRDAVDWVFGYTPDT
ncbi:MAG: hypothetical protein KDB27_00700 [Planctomycetales bacterium]|nr:hypothetical protein [Planctomycetales bacterium]